MTRPIGVAAALVMAIAVGAAQGPAQQPARHNLILFVADGLRRGSVNPEDMPTLSALRSEGVDFEDSYSVSPTYTMANASAIATGHGLGDTGVYSNTVWLQYRTFDTGNFRFNPGTAIPFLESDTVLADVDDHHRGTFLPEQTLLAAARGNGYNTAAIGKLGPIALQDVSTIAPRGGTFPPEPSTILIDDATGTTTGVPLASAIAERLREAHLATEAPTRSNGYGQTSQFNNGNSGDAARAGTLAPNAVQQQWFADVATRAVLTLFESEAKPFVLVFWSRDPDGTQHNQGDSLGALLPGINGATSRLALQNADRNLAQLMKWLDERPAIKAITDVIVTSDHGFATISKREVDASNRTTSSEATKHQFVDGSGKPDTKEGTLPYGFLAVDLAVDLHLPLFDPDRPANNGTGLPYRKVRLSGSTWEHPSRGNGLLGEPVRQPSGSDAKVIVAAGGGSDLIYVPDGSSTTVRTVVDRLLTYDYVGPIFVADQFGDVPGTLPLGAVGLNGSGLLPRPDIIVGFKVFYTDRSDLQTAKQITDSDLREGQGNHGGFGRECTFNTMAAIGPDFRERFADSQPVGNGDIVPTIAQLFGFEMASAGSLRGRVLREALRTAQPGKQAAADEAKPLRSSPANGLTTVAFYRELNSVRYIQTACLIPTTVAAETAAACR